MSQQRLNHAKVTGKGVGLFCHRAPEVMEPYCARQAESFYEVAKLEVESRVLAAMTREQRDERRIAGWTLLNESRETRGNWDACDIGPLCANGHKTAIFGKMPPCDLDSSAASQGTVVTEQQKELHPW